MSNELDTLSAGELQPYDPGQPLAPMSQDDWGNTDVDLLREDHSHQSGGLQLFGTPLPVGTTRAHVEQMLIQLGAMFANDMGSLGYPATYINATVQFYQSHATKKPFSVTPRHNFKLPAIADDYLGHAFCNMVHGLSGSPRAKQQWITSALTWLAKAVKLNSQTEGSVTSAHGSAPNSAEALLSQLSESDYGKVLKINEQAQQRTLQILANKHGQYTAQNMIALAQAHLEKLTPVERAHFDQFTTVGGVNYVHMMNCVETIEFLYNAAIGAHSIAKDGVGIAKEIAEFEAMLKVPSERARYMKDPQLQARYRTLLDLKG